MPVLFGYFIALDPVGDRLLRYASSTDQSTLWEVWGGVL